MSRKRSQPPISAAAIAYLNSLRGPSANAARRAVFAEIRQAVTSIDALARIEQTGAY